MFAFFPSLLLSDLYLLRDAFSLGVALARLAVRELISISHLSEPFAIVSLDAILRLTESFSQTISQP